MLLTALLLLSPSADAAAYYFMDTGTRGLARAGAYVAGVRDLSAQYYNPAGLIRLQRPQAYVNFSLVDQAVDFTRVDYDSSGNALTTYDTVNNQDGPMPIPALGFSSHFGLPNTVFAVGLYPPFAPTLAFPADGPQRYTLIDSLLIQTNFGPSVAHRFSDWLTLGAGVSWVYISAAQTLTLSSCDPNAAEALREDCAENPEKYDIDVALKMADPVKFNASAGLLIEPLEWLAIGASVVSPVRVSGTGDITASFGDEHALVTSGGLAESSYKDDQVTVLLDLPWIFRLGTAFYPTEKLEFELTGVYHLWSMTENITVTDVDLDLVLGETGQTFAGEESIAISDDIVLPAGFSDAWSARLGGEYVVAKGARVRGGLAYESSAVPPSTQSVSQVDGPKVAYGLGGTYVIKKRLAVDIGFSQTFIQSRDISNSEVRQIVIPVFPLTNLADPDNLNIQEGEVVGNGSFASRLTFMSAGLTYFFQKED